MRGDGAVDRNADQTPKNAIQVTNAGSCFVGGGMSPCAFNDDVVNRGLGIKSKKAYYYGVQY